MDLGTPSSIVVTINDDGDIPPPTEVILTVDRQSVLEGESVIVTVTLEKALNQAVVIPLDYSTDGVDATPEDDYIPLPELTIEAGKTVQSGSIQTLLDGEPENVETFTVAMGALPSEVVGGRPLSYTIMIVDQEPPDVSLSVDRNSVNEGEQINVTISLSRSLSNDVVIPLEVDPVSASESDYQILSTLFPEIASGQTDGQISIHAEEDRFIESPETFTVALSDDLPSSVVEGTPSSIVIKINDTNEALIDAPQSVVMVEGSEEKILVSLTAVPSNDVTVKITAMEQSNLEVAPTDLVFSADLRNQSFEVTLMATPDDNLSDDTIPLLLTASGGEYEGEEHKIDVTIIDSSQPGLVVPIAISITEGETGFFDVSLSQRPIEDVSVMILVPETPDTDLELLSSTVLTFRESNWDETQSVELMVREDPDAEPDDPVQITLNGSRGGYDGVTETVIVTIIEKDAIGIDVHPTFMRIVEEKTDELSVVLTSEPTADVEIRVSKQGDSVLRISTTPLTFTPSDWQTPQTIILKAGTDDNTMDDQEILTLRAVGGGYTGQQKQVPVTILERGPPTITIHSGRASEDEDVVRLAIELSHSTHEVVTVQYTTTDGTATAGEDYTSSRGIVIFDPGGTQGVVQFEIIPDTDEEGPETFIVTLSEPRKAIIDRAAATATIIDNDSSVPSIAIDDAVSSDNTGIMTFKIVLSQPYPYDITARYYTEDGTATAGQDYVASTGVVTFPSGSMQATIQVPVVTDDIKAQGETFFVHVEPTESLQMKKSIATAVIQQSVRTKENNALKAYTTRFVRTTSIQITEALQERLRPSGSTCSAIQRAETAQLWHSTSSWTPSIGELLSGCRVSKTQRISTGHIGVWGRGAFRRFNGRQEDALTLRGDVSTAMLGADYQWNVGWLVGMMVAHSQGTGTYQATEDDGEIDTQLTGIYPYISYEASDWEVWLSGGYGWGSANVHDMKGDLTSRFGAVGFKGNFPSMRRSRWSYYGDVLLTDAEVNTTGIRTEVIRVRLGMENTFQLSDGIRPYLEANVRQDGGDAETGVGLELGGGLRVAYPEWKLRGEVRSHGLVLHSADGFTEWGISGSIQIGSPSEGLMMRVRPSWGPNHRMILHRQQTILDATPLHSGMHRIEVELGYGMPFRRGTAQSIAGVTQLPKGRLLRLGGQLNPWDWVSFSISGLAHQYQSIIGDVSVNVQSTLRY